MYQQMSVNSKRKELIQQMQELTYVASTRASEKLFVYNHLLLLVFLLPRMTPVYNLS
jgi:hypothetical protein